MKSSKLPKPTKQDRDWQDKIAKNLEKEKVKIDHSQGLERFNKVIKRLGKKQK